LALFTSLYKDAQSTEHKINFLIVNYGFYYTTITFSFTLSLR